MSKLFKQEKKKLGKIFLLVVLLLALVAGAVTFYLISKNNGQGAEIQKISRNDEEIETIINDITTKVDNDDVAGAVSDIDRAVKETDNVEQKYDLLIEQAYIYYENDQYDQALVSATQAEGIKESSSTSALIAKIYREKGDDENAIKYFEKAISQLDITYEDYQKKVDYYQEEINSIKAGE